MLSHKITEVSGCSGYFMGTIVSYTNDLKQKLLGVKKETLIEHGAVSEQTVIEMANGALQLLEVDVAVSVSGIAGPTGGSESKPVGTIWICIANQFEHFAFKIQASKDRKKNIEYAATIALNNLRKFVARKY
jgi:nicotinamide-nucleotide amidase